MKKGDKVAVIDETLEGKVVEIADNEITLETNDGFRLSYKPEEVIIVKEKDFSVDYNTISEAIKEKQSPRKPKNKRIKPKERSLPKMEVDLHIHHLAKSTKNMTNFEMLNIQLDIAKQQLEFAIKKNIQKVVFVHGVGQGVLRAELETLFNRYENVTYYDADYQKYGVGATEVYIYQNY